MEGGGVTRREYAATHPSRASEVFPRERKDFGIQTEPNAAVLPSAVFAEASAIVERRLNAGKPPYTDVEVRAEERAWRRAIRRQRREARARGQAPDDVMVDAPSEEPPTVPATIGAAEVMTPALPPGFDGTRNERVMTPSLLPGFGG